MSSSRVGDGLSATLLTRCRSIRKYKSLLGKPCPLVGVGEIKAVPVDLKHPGLVAVLSSPQIADAAMPGREVFQVLGVVKVAPQFMVAAALSVSRSIKARVDCLSHFGGLAFVGMLPDGFCLVAVG